MVKMRVQKNSTAYNALKIIASAGAGGIAFAAILVAPGLTMLISAISGAVKEWKHEKRKAEEEIEKKRIGAAIKRLRERRLVRFEERGKKVYVVITKDGISQIKQFDFEDMKLTPSKQWDKKWRIVIFDIPEKFRKGRYALHSKLLQLGFYPLQKSVFVYPYECQDEIDFVTRFCDVDNFVCYVVSDSLDHKEISLRRHFNLL